VTAVSTSQGEGHFPAAPALRMLQGDSPTAPAAPWLHSVPAREFPTPLRSQPGSSGVRPREGRCHRNRAQDPGLRSPEEAGKEGSRDTLCPHATTPVHRLLGLLRPASSTPTALQLPAPLQKNPTFRHVGPALPAASREEHAKRSHQVSREPCEARQRAGQRMGKQGEWKWRRKLDSAGDQGLFTRNIRCWGFAKHWSAARHIPRLWQNTANVRYSGEACL
jgi:hypothetical protein